MLSAHENFTDILINGFFAISWCWNVLNDHCMVWKFGRDFSFFLEEFRILQNVFNTFGFRCLLWLELLFGRKILSIVVTQMIVRDKWLWLDSCSCQEVHKCGFEFCLACLKVVSNINSSFDLLHPWQKCILRWTVNKGASLLHWGNCKNGWGCNFGFTSFNRFHNCFVAAMKTFINNCKSFCIGSPQHNYIVQIIIFFEISNVFLDDLQMLFFIRSFKNVICSLCLIGCDEIWIINWFHWAESLHIGHKLLLKVELEDLGSFHALCQIFRVDIPTSKNEFSWVQQREYLFHSQEYFRILGFSNFHGWILGHWAVHVGLMFSFLGFPGDFVFICK